MSSIPFSGFNDHSKLKGLHAILGASKYHWVNYDDQKFEQFYMNYRAAEHGTELHDFASHCIRMNQKLPHSQKTLNMFVNDAVGFHMKSEQVLFYSDNCFGTADAICFRDGVLRIHDLKTGTVAAHMEQLMIYAALFCLEYHISPKDIRFELRIYQNDEIIYCEPESNEVNDFCKTIIKFDKKIKEMKEAE